MIIPWDFGIINAIKEQLGLAIFPSVPQQSTRQNPQIIFELKDIRQGKNQLYRVEFSLTLIDKNEGKNLEILKNITKLIRKKLSLKQENFTIGSARAKINLITTKGNRMEIDLIALLQLNDGENERIIENRGAEHYETDN